MKKRMCARPSCCSGPGYTRSDEFRIDGYCSVDCRDLHESEHERDDLLRFIEREGYRCCDIPACNCNSFHGGNAYNRLREIGEDLESAGVSLNGRTIRSALSVLIEAHANLHRRSATVMAERDDSAATDAEEWLLEALRKSRSAIGEVKR